MGGMRLTTLFVTCGLPQKGQNQSLLPRKADDGHVIYSAILEVLWVVH